MSIREKAGYLLVLALFAVAGYHLLWAACPSGACPGTSSYTPPARVSAER